MIISRTDKRYYFARHGERVDQARRLHDLRDDSGEDVNCQLTDRGWQQSRMLGEYIVRDLQAAGVCRGQKINVIASPYLRCLQTVQGMLAGIDGYCQIDKVYVTDWLSEFQKPDAARHIDDLIKDAGDLNYFDKKIFAKSKVLFERSEEDRFETKPQAFVRVYDFVDKLVEGKFETPDEITVIVTHAFFITSMIYMVSGELFNREIPECGVSVLNINENGERFMMATNIDTNSKQKL